MLAFYGSMQKKLEKNECLLEASYEIEELSTGMIYLKSGI